MKLMLSLVAVALLAGCSTPVPRAADPVPVVPSPTAEVDYSALPTEFPGNGSFLVGTDIQPGYYEEETPAANCMWYKGVDGKLTASSDGELLVLTPGETVEVAACSVWVMFAPPED